MTKKYFDPISYENNINKALPYYFWQYDEIDSKLPVDEILDYEDYKVMVLNLVNKNDELSRKLDCSNIADKLNKDYFLDSILLSDYSAYKFSRSGEKLFHIMPVLAETLMGIDAYDNLSLEECHVPFNTCYFRVPEGLIKCEMEGGKQHDVEGVFVDEIYGGEVKKENRKGIRLVAVNNNGDSLMFFVDMFDSKITDSSLNFWYMERVKLKNGEADSINGMLKFVKGVLGYIDDIKSGKKNAEIEKKEDVEEVKKEKKARKAKDKKICDEDRKMAGTNVVVLGEKMGRGVAISGGSGRKVVSSPSVCCGVRGYWRTLDNDCFSKLKGKKIWTKAHKRGIGCIYRVDTIYQVGRR